MPESEKDIITDYTEKIDQAWIGFQEGKLEDAELLCNSLIVDYPKELNANYLLGHINMERGNYNVALSHFNVALTKDVNNTAGGFIYYYMGTIYDKYDSSANSIYNTDKAEEYYIKAKEYTNFPEAVFHKLQHTYKNCHTRIEFLTEGITKFPDSLELHLHLANACNYVGDKQKEIQILLNASNKEIKSATIYFEIAKYYYKNSEYDKSRLYYFDALYIIDDDDISKYIIEYEIGNTYYIENDYTNAENYYKKSFNSGINSSDSWFGFFGLTLIYSRQNQIDEIQNLINSAHITKEVFRLYPDWDGGPIWFDLNIPVDFIIEHDLKEVIKALSPINIKENQKLKSALYLIKALIYRVLNNHIQNYNSLRKVCNDSEYYLNDLTNEHLKTAYLNLINAKSDKAQDLTKIALDFKSDKYILMSNFRVEIFGSLVRALFEVKLYKQIIELYRLFKKDEVTNAKIWFEVGYSLSDLKELKEAKFAYETYLENGSTSSAVFNNLANLYKQVDQNYLKAIEYYKKALEIQPEDKIAKNNLELTIKQYEEIEVADKQKRLIDNEFKLALKSLQDENEYIHGKLRQFIIEAKVDPTFSDWSISIPNFKFAKLIKTEKQRADSIKDQWVKKNYIKLSGIRDEYRANIYFINPFLEKELERIESYKLPELWLNGFNLLTISNLTEVNYFEIKEKILKASKKFRSLLERDYNELVFNYVVKNEKATVVLAGSLIELALTYYFEKKKIVQIPYIDSKGTLKNKNLYDCVLNDLIFYAEKQNLFGLDFQHLTNLSRIYRNFIHPGRELKNKLDKSKCDLCFISASEVLKMIL